MNGNDIVTTSNATIDLAPNGTGTVVVRGTPTQAESYSTVKLTLTVRL